MPLCLKRQTCIQHDPTKAPWYFAGVQELLMHFHPLFSAIIIPLGVLAFLAWIPFARYEEAPQVLVISEKENGRIDNFHFYGIHYPCKV